MRRPGEPPLPFEPYSGPAVAWAAEQTGTSITLMWDEFDAFRRAYKRLRPPWDEMGGRNMFEIWVVHVSYYMLGEEYNMKDYISEQHNFAPEPDWAEPVE